VQDSNGWQRGERTNLNCLRVVRFEPNALKRRAAGVAGGLAVNGARHPAGRRWASSARSGFSIRIVQRNSLRQPATLVVKTICHQ
jgi:hypothetical protein